MGRAALQPERSWPGSRTVSTLIEVRPARPTVLAAMLAFSDSLGEIPLSRRLTDFGSLTLKRASWPDVTVWVPPATAHQSMQSPPAIPEH